MHIRCVIKSAHSWNISRSTKGHEYLKKRENVKSNWITLYSQEEGVRQGNIVSPNIFKIKINKSRLYQQASKIRYM